jgi:hypothetical protein
MLQTDFSFHSSHVQVHILLVGDVEVTFY